MGQCANGKVWSHDELAHDLAMHFKTNSDRLVWEDIVMGPSGSDRPDVFTLSPSYAHFEPMVYEVKVSVPDFRSDTTSGKWEKYLAYSKGVYFAVPGGMVVKSDVPRACGLMVRYDTGWKSLKRPTLQNIDTLPRFAWTKLLIDGVKRQWEDVVRPRTIKTWITQKVICEKYGEDMARLLSNRDDLETQLREQTENLESDIEYLKQRKRTEVALLSEQLEHQRTSLVREMGNMAAMLGIPRDSNLNEVRHRMRTVMQEMNERGLVYGLKEHIDNSIKMLARESERMGEILNALEKEVNEDVVAES